MRHDPSFYHSIETKEMTCQQEYWVDEAQERNLPVPEDADWDEIIPCNFEGEVDVDTWKDGETWTCPRCAWEEEIYY